MFSIPPPPPRGFWAFLVAALMAAVPVIAAEPVPANVPPRFAAKVIKEGDRYLIEVPSRPGQLYCLEVPDGAGGMTFATVPGSAIYARSTAVSWPLGLTGPVVGAEEDGNSAVAAAGASPPAAGGSVLLPLTIEVSESPGSHVRLRVDGANPWVAVAAVAFPRVTYEGFADLPTATGVRCAALSTRVVTAPIGATEPGKAALTLEQQQEFDAIVAGLPQLIAAATLPSGLPPALGNGSPSPLSSSRYFRVAMYRVDTNGNGYLDADELASGMNPFARPGESGYVDASNAGGSNGGSGGGVAPIWDSDDDFSPDFEEIAAGTSPMFKYSAPVVLTSQALYRSAVFDSWGSWTETQVWYSGWRPDVGYWLDAIFSHPDPAPTLGTTPRAGSAFMSDFASGWNAFGLPDPKAGKGLPPQKMFEESLMGSWASFARNVYLLNGPLSGTAGNIRAFGYRYRLRGPSSLMPQARQFVELTWMKTSGFVPNYSEEAAAAALMEEAPVSVEPVTLTIPPGELYSEPHDMVSQGPTDPEMPHSQVGQYLKVVRLLPVDLAVDSDNNDGLNLPRRDGAEEATEDYFSSQNPARENPGKYIKLSFGDFDNDGIPDFADGMDIHGGAGADKCSKFTPMVADLSAVQTITVAKVRFNYSEANPTGIIKQTIPNDMPAWSPGGGNLRLWKKNGNESRKVSDIRNNGDFVKANTEYTIQELGADSLGIVTLYVEAVRRSSAAADIVVGMQVKLDGQNWIEVDKIRFTAIPRVLYGAPNSSLTPLPGSKIKPAFEDETAAIGEALGGIVGGVRLDTLNIGRYGPHPDAGSDPTKDRQRLVIRLQTGINSFTRGDDSIVLLVAEGVSEGFVPPDIAAVASEVTPYASAASSQGAPANATIPEADAPEDWEAQFERILFEKYEEATPRIEDLERDGFELWGWLYGGRSYEFFSGRDVWRSGSKIFIEDTLTPEQGADAYYNFLKQALPTDAQGVNLTPILRYYGEVYEAGGEDRAKVGQFMAKHWELVETTTGMLESEYLFTPLSFAVGGVLQIRRVNNMTFFTEGKVFAIPLVRRNWVRGNITENDTLINSLGFTRNSGEGAIKVTGTVNGQPRNYIPDSIRPHWFIEVKDWKSLSRTNQIQAAFSAAPAAQKRLAIIVTTRNRTISKPLLKLVEDESGLLFRRNLNTDTYEVWRWDTTKLWEPIDKATVIQWLSTP